jgi:ubiquinone/menaquinone biosynthesis C-methylase UbiE
MNHKQQKFESPARLQELQPAETLVRIGLVNGQTVCDIGAGTGIFTLPAARLTEGNIYALEISHDMLAILADKIKASGLNNIILSEAQEDHIDLPSESIDLVLMVTVLHELTNAPAILGEVKRILKPQGKFAIIEFHKYETPYGPPVPHRISREEVYALLEPLGFVRQQDFDLGSNFYCLVAGLGATL